ncbi:F0F1 ATP synthase subunit gamma [Akkermansiaceae bacterium]|nr:F0F1 ATP synthase subunit gamma [Akkermansiaceae bacterium]MDA7929393.1 F0F1 ATP synthase subunit gamma [Akkermansiaceae bacterium]MDB4466137.1 F0F1 ATP synthase subunit gamma [bacterium]MDB4509840.1 F0F1 ATP synthase subunit gamma [Akkermansiaceae bacterium]
MSETTESLRRQIQSAGDLQSVVRTMKALAASSIGQYENSVRALVDYNRAVELGLSVWLRANKVSPVLPAQTGRHDTEMVGAIVFGSDQGLVGQFNDVVADFAIKTLAALPGEAQIWTIGERVHARLSDAGLKPTGLFGVPNSVKAITPLVAQIQLKSEVHRAKGEYRSMYVFNNRPLPGSSYEAVSQRLLPLDASWAQRLKEIPWPSKNLPEVVGSGSASLRSLLREYLFITIFKACAESLSSENATRLASMQRAEKNIDELLATLQDSFHRLRQSSIDEELFDVVSGYEALSKRSE